MDYFLWHFLRIANVIHNYDHLSSLLPTLIEAFLLLQLLESLLSKVMEVFECGIANQVEQVILLIIMSFAQIQSYK